MNVVAKQLKRKFWWRVFQISFIETPRLKWQMRQAIRRGEPTEPIIAKVNAFAAELKKATEMIITVQRAERMLKQSGWR